LQSNRRGILAGTATTSQGKLRVSDASQKRPASSRFCEASLLDSPRRFFFAETMPSGSYYEGTIISGFGAAVMSSSTLQMGIQRLRSLLAGQGRPGESDEQLLSAFTTRHDDNAFAILMRRHGPMVLRVCRRVLGHEQDAEDAFQATFLVLARKAAALRNKTTLAGFLYGIAYRAALKAKQSAARRGKHESRAPVRASVNPADEISWREVRALLDEEIAALPEKYRTVVVLCCLENLSQVEAARCLGLKERTLSSRLEAARKRLGRRLSPRGVELSVVLSVAAWATPPASAVPPALMSSAMQAALATAAGEGIAGLVPSAVAELVKSVTTGIMARKITLATAVLLAVTLLAGAGAWTFITRAIPHPNSLQVEAAVSLLPLDAAHPAGTPKQQSGDFLTVSGRVLDPDGKPVSKAQLFVPQPTKVDHALLRDPIGTTDAQGRFRVSFRLPNDDSPNYLLAHAPGFGVDWIELKERERQIEATLRLVKDVPIDGRVVNTEGRPVGNVSVSITGIYVPTNGKLDDCFKDGMARFHDKLNLQTPQHLWDVLLDGITGKRATDKDGRFTLRGAGRERIVLVRISGGGVVRSTFWIITRPGFDGKPYNAELQKDHEARGLPKAMASQLFLYPPSHTFVAETGKAIEGTVKDTASGKPIPGCRVIGQLEWGTDIGEVISGADGSYRLEGVPKNAVVMVEPSKGSTYLSRRIGVDNTDRIAKAKLDIELAKGAVIVGRVLDKQTGQGVMCGIRFAPLQGNKFYGSKPGFDYREYDWPNTDKDGRFRRVTIPGKVLVLAQVHQPEKHNGLELHVYRKAVPDPDHKDLFKPERNGWVIGTAGGNAVFIPGLDNVVKVIDAKEDGETRVDLFLDRGRTARIEVQDPAGKPLAGVWAEGLSAQWPYTHQLPEATATVFALNPDEPRTMVFFHDSKKLGGMATVRGDEKEAIVVKLAPLGSVSGRLVAEDGKPLKDVDVSIIPDSAIGTDLYRMAAPSGKPVRTDKDGRFRVDGVVPNLKCELQLRQGRTILVRAARFGALQVKAGEIADLGDVTIKPTE
jgi:RNA polymerase sigma factor (sigma-70 family)